MTSRLLSQAKRDVDEIASFIAIDSRIAAGRFYEIVDEAIELILRMPGIGTLLTESLPRFNDVRRLTLQWENYQLFYSRIGDEIVIIRAVHGARSREHLLDVDD